MVVPSWTASSTAGGTPSCERSEIPWSSSTSPTVPPLAVTRSTAPSTLRVTFMPTAGPIAAYPAVVPMTAVRATAAAPTRAALLLLTRASSWRKNLQTSSSPRASGTHAPGRRFRMPYPIRANSHKTLRKRVRGPNSPTHGVTSLSCPKPASHPRWSAGGGSSPGPAEGHLGVGVESLAEGGEIITADVRHGAHRHRYQVRRVRAPAVGRRRQERRVGLDQHPIQRRHAECVAQRLGVLEGDRAGEAQVRATA